MKGGAAWKGIKEAFIDAGEISQMLGIGMTEGICNYKGI